MKTELANDKDGQIESRLALHVMINRVSASSLVAATRKQSFIVNDVPADLQVNTNEQMLATISANLLNTLITHTSNCCIRVSAQLHGSMVMINFKESHPVSNPAFTGSLRELQLLAEKIGGSISLTTEPNRTTTIVFSFLNHTLAA